MDVDDAADPLPSRHDSSWLPDLFYNSMHA